MISEQQAQVGAQLSKATYDNVDVVTVNGVTYERNQKGQYLRYPHKIIHEVAPMQG